jgi:carbon starvation protein
MTPVRADAPAMTPAARLVWVAISLLGAFAFGGIALRRGEAINSLWIVVAALCVYAIGFRFYSLFIARRVLELDGSRATPAPVGR